MDRLAEEMGKPVGEYYLMSETERSTVTDTRNLLANGEFELSDDRGKPTEWKLVEPIQVDSTARHDGRSSARIVSNSPRRWARSRGPDW